MRVSWSDSSAENLSFLSCDSCDSCSIDGMGESKEDVVVHSLIDVSVDMLDYFSCEAFERIAFCWLAKYLAEQKLQGVEKIETSDAKD